MYGIYEFADQTNDGKYYVGSAAEEDLRDRLLEHIKDKRLANWNEVVWSEITAKGIYVRIAERIRMEQIAEQLGGRDKMANTFDAHPISKECIQEFWKREIWRQIPKWPNWLYPLDSLLK